jgi:hypothetical protein
VLNQNNFRTEANMWKERSSHILYNLSKYQEVSSLTLVILREGNKAWIHLGFKAKMTDYIVMSSRILFPLRAAKSTVAKSLLHSSACNVTTGLGFNSIILLRKFINNTCMKASSCEPSKGVCRNKLGDTSSSLDRDNRWSCAAVRKCHSSVMCGQIPKLEKVRYWQSNF